MPSDPPQLPAPPPRGGGHPGGPGYPSYPPYPAPAPPTEPGLMGGQDERPPELDGPPRRTSPLTLALNLGGAFVAIFWLLPELLSTNSGSSRSSPGQSPIFLIVIVVALGVQLLIGALTWFARTYTVSARELVIDEGILGRRRKVVPFARVQQVDITQGLVPQVLRLATLRIDTAGEGGAAVKLGMLDIRLARGLRTHILRRRAELQGTLRPPAPGAATTAGTSADMTVGGTAGVPVRATAPIGWAVGPEQVLLHLGANRLALAGITHHLVVIGIPVFLVIGLWIGAVIELTNRKIAASAALGGSLAVAAGVAVLFAFLSVLQYVLGQYGFTLAEQGDDLHLRYGLLQVRNLTIPRRRVQHVTVVDNPVRRALGIVAIHLHSAAPISGEGQGGAATRFEIPILPREHLDEFLHALMGGDWHVPALTPRSAAARRRAITRRVVFLALVLIVPAVAFRPGSFLLLGLALFGIPWGLLAHERAGFAETPEIVVLSHGALHHHIDLLPYSRVQSCRVEQNPLQRMNELSTLHVNVAGPSRDPHLYDMPDAPAVEYLRDLPRRSLAASDQT